MFELSVACKYLIPRRRQLSVSIISLVSVLVIALVVWLIVVFFSVTDGLEKSWVRKLTALTAPVRITPTEAYYQSYYYLVDSVSEASNYSHKTIREKLEAPITDPYDPDSDEELPRSWPQPDLDGEGNPKDLVKLAYQSIEEVPNVAGLTPHDFELTATHIRLKLLRKAATLHAHTIYGSTSQSSLSYPAYLGNFDGTNLSLEQTLLPLQQADLNNLLTLMDLATNDEVTGSLLLPPEMVHKRLLNYFSIVNIHALTTRSYGWLIPRQLWPQVGRWMVCAIMKHDKAIRLIVPQTTKEMDHLYKALEEQGLAVAVGYAALEDGIFTFYSDHREPQQFPSSFTLTLAGGTPFRAELDPASIDQANRIEHLRFVVEIPLQGTVLKGKVLLKGLDIDSSIASTPSSELSPFWVHRLGQANGTPQLVLPKDPEAGEGVILPKSFRDAGVLIGDRGSLSYFAPTASLLQEQVIPIYVAGFYDPGIIPIGGKFILANPEVTSLIRSSHQQEDKSAMTNGINVHFQDMSQADQVKANLEKAFRFKGIHPYWKVETYREYEFTKEIMQELQSQKNLFLLIAVVIILVACSNIISMLIILVNDKKSEIGILRSMGATSKSIALIFGTAGAVIGVFGSVLGILAAIVTLRHLDLLVSLLSKVQGHDMFNTNLYGQALPRDLSWEALSFVLGATAILSLLAGIVPAIKACLMRPSQILRSGGG